MGLDELHLRVLATSSEDLTQKRNAQKGLDEIISFIIIISIDFFVIVLKLMQKGRHWVLVVLLLGNVVSMCVLDV
jgi:metal transporter CNNM